MNNKYLTLLAASSFAFFMQACGDDSSSASLEDDPIETVSTAFVFGSDYKAGELRWIEDGKISKSKLDFYQDSKVVSAGKNVFVLERSGADNVNLIDVEKKDVAWQVSLDDYSNPSDVVLANEKEAWVALADAEKFVKISLKDGEVVKSVKTGAFTTKGGSAPNLVDFEVSGDTLFAIFQRYVMDAETWVTTFPKGLLAMYKLSDGALLDTVQLATKNPMAVKVVKGNVFVATQGEYNADYGTDADDKRGIEKVDLAKKKSSLFVSGEKLGGGVSGLAADYKAGTLYASVYKSFGDVPVAAINVADGKVSKVDGIADAEGGMIFGADGVLYVGDRSYGAEAVYTYDGSKAAKVESSAKDALPPYSIAF